MVYLYLLMIYNSLLGPIVGTLQSIRRWRFLSNALYRFSHSRSREILKNRVDHFEWCHIVKMKYTNISVARETYQNMMTSWNGNIFRFTGPLCEEFTGHRWISSTKASDAELWYFLWSAHSLNGWVNNREAGDLRRHHAHYDVIVIYTFNPVTSTVCWWHNTGDISSRIDTNFRARMNMTRVFELKACKYTSP